VANAIEYLVYGVHDYYRPFQPILGRRMEVGPCRVVYDEGLISDDDFDIVRLVDARPGPDPTASFPPTQLRRNLTNHIANVVGLGLVPVHIV
jgi:hypothetical protein